MLQQMAVTDKSLYLDTTNENGPKLMNSGKVGDAGHRAVGPQLAARHRLRRAGDADVRRLGRRPPDDRRARTTGWCSTTATSSKQAAVDFVKWLTARRAGQGVLAGAPATCRSATSVGQDPAVLDKLNENAAGHRDVRAEPDQREEGPADGRAVPRHLRGAGPGDRVGACSARSSPRTRSNTAAQATDAALAEK